MSKSNQVQLIGMFGQDPNKVITTDGKIIATFSFATHEHRKDQNGQPTTETEWHNVVSFGKLAEIISSHMKKG